MSLNFGPPKFNSVSYFVQRATIKGVQALYKNEVFGITWDIDLSILLEMDSESFAVLDTAAVVHLNSGDLKQARHYMKRALIRMNKDDYSALEIKLNWARILYRMEEYKMAKENLQEIMKTKDSSYLVFLHAKELLKKVNKKLEEKKQ